MLNVRADWMAKPGYWSPPAEAETAEQVTAKLRNIAPELIRENRLDHESGGELRVEVTFH